MPIVVVCIAVVVSAAIVAIGIVLYIRHKNSKAKAYQAMVDQA